MYHTASIKIQAATFLGVLCGSLAVVQPARGAIGEQNVLVLYNADAGPSGAGQQIADYYKSVRPGVHVVGLTGISSIFSGDDTVAITASQYLNVIRPQVLSAIGGIASSIDVIVTTKGLPLEIDAGPKPESSSSLKWKRYSSLESELTRIDSIDTVEKMGDQFIWPGFADTDPTLPNNPYYNTNAPFVREGSDPVNEDIRLAARLDGYSVETVIGTPQNRNGIIDRARSAYAVPLPYGPMIVMDDDPTAGVDQLTSAGTGPGDGLQEVASTWQQAAEAKLAQSLNQPGYAFATPFGQYNGTDAAITTAPGPVIGYVSHGTNDGAGGLDAGYIQSQLQFPLAKGAVFLTHESFNGNSFNPAFPQTQGLIAQWLERGGTAGLGHVAEPWNGPDNVANEDLFFQMMLPPADSAPGTSGLTFVEAAWNATRQLSYVNTVVGDPLMKFRMWTPGDANLSGTIGASDYTAWLLGAGGATPNWSVGDFNGDGSVGISDFFIWKTATSPPGGQGATGGDTDSGTNGGNSGIPEPASIVLAGLAIIGIFDLTRRGKTRSQRPG